MSVRQPRIVLDARMAEDGGIGTYLQLLPRIARSRADWRFTVLGNEHRMRSLGWGEIPNVRLTHVLAPIFSVREQIELPLHVDHDASLYWAPNYDVPVFCRTPMVVTIHDVNHVALPELLGGVVRRTYARWMLDTAVRRARQVLFCSEFSRQEAARLLGDVWSMGTVVHNGVDESWQRARESFPKRPHPDPYLLYVGNIKRHKNVPFLLRAFRRVVDRVPHRLVLIGRTEGLRADPDVAAALAPLGARATLLGEVAPGQVQQYVAHADALVTASLYEGFGLPALEAMAAGTPCLVSTAGSLPEICGNAALYGDPRDEQSYADRIAEIATSASVRNLMIARGRTRAAQFNWDRSAQLTTQVLERALS